jgi:hypothetical protein
MISVFERLLLGLATYDRVPLCTLLYNEFEALFNRPWPRWSEDDLRLCLGSLFQRGFIEFSENEVVLSEFSEFRRNLEPKSLAARTVDPGVSYGLTSKASSIWEECFHPRWEKLIIDGYVGDDAPMTLVAFHKEEIVQVLFRAFYPNAIIMEWFKLEYVRELKPLYWYEAKPGWELSTTNEDAKEMDYCSFMLPWHDRI